jgi:ABC-2 type transport system permease protein
MTKIALIAKREFIATVGNKGFVIGLLIMPAIIAVAAFIGPRLMNASSPQVRGAIAVIDRTGRVAGQLREVMTPAAIEARRLDTARRALAQAAPGTGQAVTDQNIQRLGGTVPDLRVVERPAESEVAREKDVLIPKGDDERNLALIVVHGDAVSRAPGQPEYGAYDLYVAPTLDAATESVIHDGVRQALVNARLDAGSLDRGVIEAAMQVSRPQTVIVTAAGEQASQRGFTRALPFILGILMFIGVMIGGQTLMTSTVEEKSSRVVEVLLATVSPFELMAGKLLGQLAVGMVAMAIYVGMGLFVLYSFAMLGLIDPMLVVYLTVFFLITYLVFGALMTAIGASVNQMADAQSLMGPVMMLLVLPYILSPMIGRAPNSTFSVVMSFLPPFNTFVMMSRLASDSPPPAWQVWLTVGIGIGAAYAAIWFAAKVFKIGLLMHGKPPNFATLIRWAREA